MGKTFTKRTKQARNEPWFNPGTSSYGKMFDKKEYSACGKKVGAYGHEKEALAAAQNIPGKQGIDWRAYECPYCKKYHLTSGKKKTP